MKRQLLIIALLLLVVLGGAGAWKYSAGHKPTFSPPAGLEMTLLPEPRALSEFSLTGQDSEPFTLERLQDRWTVMFFGYTHCPDICPTTLATLTQFNKKLEEAKPDLASDTQFVFVSVDPQRDDPKQLKEYVSYFNPQFIGTTGAKAEINALANQVGAIYAFEGDTSAEDYIVNHSAALYLIDPEGRYVARFFPPHKVDEMLAQYERIRSFFN